MEKESSLCDFQLYSHPDKILYTHLLNVGNKSASTSETKKLSFEKIGLERKTFTRIAYLIGICHDFGKGTGYFQKYLLEADPKRKRSLKNKKESHHGLISALFTYYILKKYIDGIQKEKELRYIPLIGYLAVKRHHGNLMDAEDEIGVLVEEDILEILELQINSLYKKELEDIYGQLLRRVEIFAEIDFFCKEEASIATELLKSRRKFRRFLKKETSTGYYLLTLIFYSILINSDKIDASAIETCTKEIRLSPNLVDKYKQAKDFCKNESGINQIRNEIYEEVIDKVEKLKLDKKIYSINVPTGTGKTLTSFSFALKLRARLKKERGINSKIIYSLPFLSVIDQNYAVFEDIFRIVEQKIPTEDLLLKHHHLTDIFYKTQKDEEFEGLKGLFLIEGWNSEIIVTTFVQFFHTIISNKNRSLRKFHNIANSIVILDEVQSIPHKYWLVLKQIISGFAAYLNTYFIFVTATQPLIFDPEKEEITELVANKEKYFKKFDRIKLETNLTPMPLEEFEVLLKKELIENPEKDILVVLNTIKTSLKVYNSLKDLKLVNSSYQYLSTNIIPKVRLERIKEIKEASKKRKIIVSTQLIEAGVDIDVDIVYRDFSTIDSINQVAGRCNRNSSKEKRGEVKLFLLKAERKEFHQYVYSSFLTDKTKEVFKESPSVIYEKDLLALNEKYFRKVKATSSEDESLELLSKINGLKFKSLSSDFHLIENKTGYEKLDVFVELDETAIKIWKEFLKIKALKKPFEKRARYLKIRKEFKEYIISVPKKDFFCEELEALNLGYIPFEQISHYYNFETGFSLKKESSMIL
ncbi:MAG: CRISPR-associated helicase Cas3' [Methanosarcinaceae archaeon]|nr:CRISPR-associated helicase Cas3' [Methanosarcinaceae archaeon]MDD4749876.1 CRISPR-associated helicase Cas3' [Methanosarcinaceae archaeon]